MRGPRKSLEQRMTEAQNSLAYTAAEVVKKVRSGELVFTLNEVDEKGNLFIKRSGGYFAIMADSRIGTVKTVKQESLTVCTDLSDLKRIQQLLDEYLGR